MSAPFVDLGHSPARPKTGCPMGEHGYTPRNKGESEKKEGAGEERMAGVKKKLSGRSQYAYAKSTAWPRARRRRVSIYFGVRVHSSPKRLETAAARKKILSARRNSVDQSSLAIIISRGNAHTRDGNKLRAHTTPFSSPYFFFLPKRIIL